MLSASTLCNNDTVSNDNNSAYDKDMKCDDRDTDDCISVWQVPIM
jgi:hypothetical protein